MLTIDFDRFRIARGMIALDIGCGRGRHSLEFLRRGCRTVAMDLAMAELRYSRYLLASMIQEVGEVRENSRSAAVGSAEKQEVQPAAVGSNFLVMKADALVLPFDDARFDRIICSEVLEHVPDPRQAVAELFRVLKPGGMIAASVPTPFTEVLNKFSSDDYFNSPGGHVRIFTAGRLFGLLEGEGLRVVDLHFEHAFHSLYWWMRGVFGLQDEAQFVTRHLRKILTHVLFSAQLTRMERWCNHVFPKSMVFYAHKSQPRPPA